MYKKTVILFLWLLCTATSSYAATYYIDFTSGSDAASGTSKSTPWQHHPYMVGWKGSYAHSAGDQFIFKGGVTWTSGCFPMAIVAGGSSGAGNDYYGVDKTWYAGGSWTQPIFDGNYSVPTLVYLGEKNYLTIDNLELRYINPSVNFGPALIAGGTSDYILLENLYLHGWRTTATKDDAHGAVIFIYSGQTVNSVRVTASTITNAENSGPNQNGVALRSVQQVDHSTIHDVSSAVLFTGKFFNNTVYNVSFPTSGAGSNASFDPTYHSNFIYMDNGGGSIYAYNNFLYNSGTGSGFLYPNPHGGQTHYIYNNVFYGAMTTNGSVQIDTYNYGSGSGGTVYVFNNTFVVTTAGVAIRIVTIGANRPKLDSLTTWNNHVIGSGVSLSDAVQGTNVTTLSTGTNLTQTAAVASGQGYTVGNQYAPTAVGSTIDAGTSEASYFTSDIVGTARPQGAAWDIGAYELSGKIPNPPNRVKTN